MKVVARSILPVRSVARKCRVLPAAQQSKKQRQQWATTRNERATVARATAQRPPKSRQSCCDTLLVALRAQTALRPSACGGCVLAKGRASAQHHRARRQCGLNVRPRSGSGVWCTTWNFICQLKRLHLKARTLQISLGWICPCLPLPLAEKHFCAIRITSSSRQKSPFQVLASTTGRRRRRPPLAPIDRTSVFICIQPVPTGQPTNAGTATAALAAGPSQGNDPPTPSHSRTRSRRSGGGGKTGVAIRVLVVGIHFPPKTPGWAPGIFQPKFWEPENSVLGALQLSLHVIECTTAGANRVGTPRTGGHLGQRHFGGGQS